MPSCSVTNCSYNSNSDFRRFRLFHFPKNEERRKLWIKCCGRPGWFPSDYARICEIHFDESQFEKNGQDGRKFLKWNAVPNKFVLPNRIPLKRQCVNRETLDDKSVLEKRQENPPADEEQDEMALIEAEVLRMKTEAVDDLQVDNSEPKEKKRTLCYEEDDSLKRTRLDRVETNVQYGYPRNSFEKTEELEDELAQIKAEIRRLMEESESKDESDENNDMQKESCESSTNPSISESSNQPTKQGVTETNRGVNRRHSFGVSRKKAECGKKQPSSNKSSAVFNKSVKKSNTISRVNRSTKKSSVPNSVEIKSNDAASDITQNKSCATNSLPNKRLFTYLTPSQVVNRFPKKTDATVHRIPKQYSNDNSLHSNCTKRSIPEQKLSPVILDNVNGDVNKKTDVAVYHIPKQYSNDNNLYSNHTKGFIPEQKTSPVISDIGRRLDKPHFLDPKKQNFQCKQSDKNTKLEYSGSFVQKNAQNCSVEGMNKKIKTISFIPNNSYLAVSSSLQKDDDILKKVQKKDEALKNTQCINKQYKEPVKLMSNGNPNVKQSNGNGMLFSKQTSSKPQSRPTTDSEAVRYGPVSGTLRFGGNKPSHSETRLSKSAELKKLLESMMTLEDHISASEEFNMCRTEENKNKKIDIAVQTVSCELYVVRRLKAHIRKLEQHLAEKDKKIKKLEENLSLLLQPGQIIMVQPKKEQKSNARPCGYNRQEEAPT